MNIQNFKIFDKKGSQLNWTPDTFLQLIFNSGTGKNAKGYLYTDSSGYIAGSKIINSGYLYDTNTTVSYSYAYSDQITTLTSQEVSINYVDVSIFNPDPTNTKGISSLILDVSSRTYVYPTLSYGAAIFLTPVSKGLVETEHLFIFEESSTGEIIRPFDPVNSQIIFEFAGSENQIQFFEVDENSSEITWTDTLVFDASLFVKNTPISLNIGFKSDDEGVFERTIEIYHNVGGNYYILGEIVVNAEAIGEDERFRDLLTNFGAPDPKDFPKLFKEVDIEEDNPDWKVLNQKSKHMILEHDKIMPFVGTYKALINALKWLGYDDIYVREWFKNVKENTKISFLVPFEASDRTQTLLMFSPEQRKVFKKLNQLSLIYCLTKETGEVDEWGTPETENCYSYSLNEVFIKLLSLKQWLEKNIIGINCRIVDLTGEGIYIERVRNLIYTTDNVGYNYSIEQTLTPEGVDESSELIKGDSSINLTLLELSKTKLKDLNFRFIDMADNAWHPLDADVFYQLDDPSYLSDPSSFLVMGATFKYPFASVRDVMWKLSVQKDYAGVVTENFVTNPLFIYENEIRYYNIFDSSSVFYDTSTNLTLLLEKAYLRDPSIDEWVNSISYTIYPDPCDNGDYIMESSSGFYQTFHGYVAFTPDTGALLQYAVDDNYKVPLLTFNNFKCIDSSNTQTIFAKTYILDILDGKIAMNGHNVTNSSDNQYYYINFNYDTSLSEQQITLNVEYTSPRMILSQVNPSIYYWADPSIRTGGNADFFIEDNSVYTMKVNHIGDYYIQVYAWDSYNNILFNIGKEQYKVWTKYPTIYFLVDNSTYMGYEVSTYMTLNEVSTLISQNPYPIYDRRIPLQGLTVETDVNGKTYISVPSITYFQDVPESNSYNLLYNLTERVTSIVGTNITVDPDFQQFFTDDYINLVKFDKGKYSLITESSSFINLATGNTLTLDVLPTGISIDSSSEVYIQNDTLRRLYDVSNGENTFTADISTYTFKPTQMVAIVVTDQSTNYSWSAAYKVSESISNLSWNRCTYDYSSLDGLDILSAISTDPGWESYRTSPSYDSGFSVSAGDNMRFIGYLTHNSGSYPYIMVKDGTGIPGMVSTTFVFLSAGWNDITIPMSRDSNYASVVIETVGLTNYSLTNIKILFDKHTFEGTLPKQFVNDQAKYKIEAKHAFSAYSSIQLKTDTASEVNNEFKIYLKDSYYQENYLDNTFVYANIPFDEELINVQWYDASLNLVNSPFYYYNKPIQVDASTLVIMRSLYDNSTYMLNQKNIWTATNNTTGEVLFRVFNNDVPYIFDSTNDYNITVESYDKYGNINYSQSTI